MFIPKTNRRRWQNEDVTEEEGYRALLKWLFNYVPEMIYQLLISINAPIL
jgi:hypothetical protein